MYLELVNILDGTFTAGITVDDTSLAVTDANYVNTTEFDGWISIGPRSITLPANSSGSRTIPTGLGLKMARLLKPENLVGIVVTISINTRWPS